MTTLILGVGLASWAYVLFYWVTRWRLRQQQAAVAVDEAARLRTVLEQALAATPCVEDSYRTLAQHGKVTCVTCRNRLLTDMLTALRPSGVPKHPLHIPTVRHSAERVPYCTCVSCACPACRQPVGEGPCPRCTTTGRDA